VTFPKKCTDEIMEFYCNVVAIGTSDFKLRPTDQLLSAVLEMRPNGVVFRKVSFIVVTILWYFVVV